jgi:two-component system C4-dicarboxylate transport response regulator DctD
MPPAIPSSRSHRQTASDESTGNSARVCLLDDDVFVLKSAERLLKSDGIEVEKFSQPARFLAAIGDCLCRVAILDVWMPEMNGLKVQSILRKQSPQTRVILMSGRDDPTVRHTALKGGAFGFLFKPFDDEVFLQLVRKAVHGSDDSPAPKS